MEGQYVIIDLRTMDHMKDFDGNIKYYDTEDAAVYVCGMYEMTDVWILRLIHNIV